MCFDDGTCTRGGFTVELRTEDSTHIYIPGGYGYRSMVFQDGPRSILRGPDFPTSCVSNIIHIWYLVPGRYYCCITGVCCLVVLRTIRYDACYTLQV